LIAAIIPAIGMIVAIVMITSALAGPEPATAVLAVTMILFPVIGVLELGWFIVYTVMQAGRGSIGMRAQGLRLANASDGSALGFGRTLLRNVIWGLAASIVVGYFTALFDGSGRFQGWHDKVAGSVMLAPRAREAGTAPQFLDATQPPLVPGDRRSDAVPPAMPGFSAPQAPQTSMPGFGQTPGAFLPPSTGSVPPEPTVAPAAPPLPGAAPAAAPDAAEEEFAEHTVLSPRITRELPDDPLISFVPGVTQEPMRRPVQPEPAQPEPAQPEPAQPTYAAPAPAPSPPAEPVSAAVTAPAAVVSEPTASIVRPADAPHADDDEDIESTRISVPGHRLVFTWDDGQ